MTSRSVRSVNSRVNDQLFSARSANDPQNDRYGANYNQNYPSNNNNNYRSAPPGSGRPPSSSSNSAPIMTENSNHLSNSPASNTGLHDQYGLSGGEDSDPLQLEHMLGYSGDHRKTVLCMSNDEQLFVKAMGSLVTLENLNDPHAQRFLRGHDMNVCCLAVSNSGRYIASGQLGTTNYKGNAAPVLLWKTDTAQRIGVLRGLAVKATILAFSADDKFLCGCGEDCLLYIWDLSTGEVVYGQKTPSAITVLAWAYQKKINHNIDYELVIGMNNVVSQGLLTYDSMRMQWSLKWRAYTVPPMGSLTRTFYCLDLSRDRVFVYIGTSSGEMMVYRRDTVVFRSCIPVCTNGLQDIVTLPDDSVICGGGDGAFVRLIGSDMTWQKSFEIRMDSMIRSISPVANGRDLLVACQSGAIYRCSTDTFTQTLVSIGTNSAITCIAFPTVNVYPPPPNIYYFATGLESGEIRTWDLTDYSCLSSLKLPKSGKVLSLVIPENDRILSGWFDGSIRCSDMNGKQLWFIPTAHRDGTRTIDAFLASNSVGLNNGKSGPPDGLNYFVTGGGDGAIRVWKYSNRELITQYTEHRQGVSKVLVDISSPQIVHSVGGDNSVLSYDLKAGRRIISHIVNNGVMASMTQRKDSEKEIITSDSVGRLLFWDVDIREPVLAVQDPSRQMIRVCQVSPSGRFMAFAGDDMILKVLDCVSFQIISLGQSHSASIYSLVWTPDEKQILTGGKDNCLTLWNFFLGGEGK